jgi:molecular chaperone DnaJ
MAKRDYYDVLGVSRSASEAEIKRVYRRMARKLHPDVNPGDKRAEEKFKELQEAYDVLSDPEKRKVYDRFGVYGDRQAGSGGFQSGAKFDGFDFDLFNRGGSPRSFSDIFSELFGGRGRAAETGAQAPPRDLEYHISIPFLEAVRGTQASISVARRERCARCSGKGSSSGAGLRACPACGGSGQVEERRGAFRFAGPCRHCRGAGRIRAADCAECGGVGTSQRVETMSVRIPAGVNNGSRVRVPGKGDAGAGDAPPADLYLVIQVEPHHFFERDGNNLICRVPLTVTEAALGAKIEVPTIDGAALLKIPAGTQSGQRFRLRGRGSPPVKGGARGDLLVEAQIVLPRIQDERSKEILREFARLNPEDPRADLKI